MTKAPAVKFPRIVAGFYNVTLDGELVGYIAKKVEGKVTTWTVYNTNEPDLTIETLPVSAIADETELFREAKEFAKNYFPNLPTTQEDETEEVEMEQEVETVELQAPEWSEDETQDFFDEVNEFEEVEEEEFALA
jgi:hypothetical protein